MKYAFALAVILTAGLSFAQNAVNTEDEVPIGGIKQFITIQSADSALPLLLFLHGGPGGSVLSYSEKFTDRLQQHFTVVQWDQRDTGRTLALNPSPDSLTLKLFQQDTEELVGYLLKRYKQKKLYLVAHSWGTALGFHLARKHPEWLYAYIPIGAMINQLESERRALSIMKDQARDERQLQELQRINIPFETGEQLYYHRKWLLHYGGARKTLSADFVNEWAKRWLKVFNEASRENLFITQPNLGCPVYFFAGRKDLQTSSSLIEAYFSAVKAPKKDLFWFDTGHSIPAAAPARMQEIIIRKILPETFIIEKPEPLISTQ